MKLFKFLSSREQVSKISPLGDRVVFSEKSLKAAERLIKLPDGAEVPPDEVELRVVAIGPRVTDLKVGDRITLTNQAPSVLSAHNINNSSDVNDILFSIPVTYVAGKIMEE